MNKKGFTLYRGRVVNTSISLSFHHPLFIYQKRKMDLKREHILVSLRHRGMQNFTWGTVSSMRSEWFLVNTYYILRIDSIVFLSEKKWEIYKVFLCVLRVINVLDLKRKKGYERRKVVGGATSEFKKSKLKLWKRKYLENQIF